MKPPKFSARTLEAIQKVVTGNPVDDHGAVAPYQSGPALIAFFSDFGFGDTYPRGGGFPSRWAYAESRLSELNGTPRIIEAIEAAVAPQRFWDSSLSVERAVEYLNRYL